MNHAFKMSAILVVVLLLGWSISIFATSDISSANTNFSIIGTISNISEDEISVSDAKSSKGDNNTNYVLDIKNIEKIQTNEYFPLDILSLKNGDKIIAQGLTNGSTFFVKRIISFSSNNIEIVASSTIATSTDMIETSIYNATTTVSTSTDDNTIGLIDIITVTATTSIDDVSTSTDISTTTDTIEQASTTESTTTAEDLATSTMDTIIDTVESVIDVVVNIVEEVIEVITPDPVTNTTPEENNIINIETSE